MTILPKVVASLVVADLTLAVPPAAALRYERQIHLRIKRARFRLRPCSLIALHERWELTSGLCKR
jgi:hypothetical protein